MARVVVVQDEARVELAEAQEFYDREAPGRGLVFLEAVERQLELLLEYPLVGGTIVRGARRRVLQGWPYSIVYQTVLGNIYVVAIVHHSRRPGYWRKRLRRP